MIRNTLCQRSGRGNHYGQGGEKSTVSGKKPEKLCKNTNRALGEHCPQAKGALEACSRAGVFIIVLRKNLVALFRHLLYDKADSW